LPPELPKTQRAVAITAPGGPEVLSLREGLPVPSPGFDEVLIRVVAAGVNRHDCNQRRRGPSQSRSDVPGLEVSGYVVMCGEGVSRERVGRPVFALTDGGGYGEYVVTPSALAFDCPPQLDLVGAAGLAEALFTVWLNCFVLMRMAPGESLLIHGGASGVGSIAIPLMSALGHTVYATAGTEEKRQFARDLGAAAVFDYAHAGWGEQLRSAVGARGVDAILDMSAGAHVETDFEALATGGRMAFLSPGGAKPLGVPLRRLMEKRIHLTGAMLRTYPLDGKKEIAAELRRHGAPLFGTAVTPRIDSTFVLEQAGHAHARMESNEHRGKILLAVVDES